VLHFLPDTAPVISVNSVGACPDDTAHAAVAVVGFRDIGRFRLTLLYDPSSTDYLNFTGHPGYPGLSVSQGSPGVLVVTGQVTAGYSGITLTDSAVLFTLHFRIRGNASPVTWHTEDDSCSFHGPPPDYNLLKDLPEQAHYLSGTVFSELPGAAGIISGPAGGLVSRGETGIRFFLQPVPGAEGYHWTLPDDMIVTGGEGTNDITVTAGSTFRQGDVYTRAVSHCGDGAVSPRFHVTDTATLGLPDTGYDMASTCQVVARGFPNPFSGVVTIAYDQPCRGKVQLVISDMLGNQLLNTETPDESAGKHEFDFSPGLKSSGVFFAIITLSTSTGVYQQTIKLICHG